MAPEPKFYGTYVHLLSFWQLIIKFLHYCINYSVICYGWQSAHLKALLHRTALRIHAQKEIRMCCQSQRTVFGDTNRLFSRM
jgi:hypothetical protein